MPVHLRLIMTTFTEVGPLQEALSKLKGQGKTIGFVPTMGALHEGHLSLIRKAKSENDYVVVSIFVNPTQFNDPNDLLKYPRDPKGDQSKLESVNTDFLFMPSVDVLYPEKVESEHFELGTIETIMEGSSRPGHFQGVATVVAKFFSIILPTKAYFGEKDFQQVAVIRKLVELKNFPIAIVSCPTTRETDGLAMSSRNLRLSPDERAISARIFQAMNYAKNFWDIHTIHGLKALIIDDLEDAGLKPEYIEIADPITLNPLKHWGEHPQARIFIAAWNGDVRLIDNMLLF